MNHYLVNYTVANHPKYPSVATLEDTSQFNSPNIDEAKQQIKERLERHIEETSGRRYKVTIIEISRL